MTAVIASGSPSSLDVPLPVASGGTGSATAAAACAAVNSGNLTLTSSQTTPLPAVAQLCSFAHGLGFIPASAELELVCLTAELGYSVGDVVTPMTQGAAGYITPICVRKTATVVEVRTGSNIAWNLRNHTTGLDATVTAANWAWRFKVRAY